MVVKTLSKTCIGPLYDLLSEKDMSPVLSEGTFLAHGAPDNLAWSVFQASEG